MKHNIKYILSVCIGIALTMGLSAQTLNSSYFMEKMTKRNQLNPDTSVFLHSAISI